MNEKNELVEQLDADQREYADRAERMRTTPRVSPMPGQMLAHLDFGAPQPEGKYVLPVRKENAEIEEANLITSAVADSLAFEGVDPFGPEEYLLHKPVLDIDLPAKLIESSRPGHYHLFIDKEMSWGQYVRLLMALAEAGILERGYVSASLERGYSCVRLPWVKKDSLTSE